MLNLHFIYQMHYDVQLFFFHVYFQKGRIKFLDEHGNFTKHCAPYDSVWIVFEKRDKQENNELQHIKE